MELNVKGDGEFKIYLTKRPSSVRMVNKGNF